MDKAKLVERCTYPLTGLKCVSRLYTDVAVFQIEPGGVVRVVEDAAGAGPEELRRMTGLELVSRAVTSRFGLRSDCAVIRQRF